ncbi:ATP-binding protein [Parabacteroides acidifaciens]|uniref:ATP-binding protein n=1 Tax=Parabacteroides acidifaciens TaxID=2290935 RepID=A0A3D8HFU2_9BACT|nr:ATP-binding protein [Parabacteroides acidifaciens]MBC8601798.1 ATP-binding protein [Parabacteroides acidifaciens]RDU49522.1 ATP-binding protein [Parabacteroides acidifaciens]
MDNLIRIYKKLLRETDTSFYRYLYHEIDWNNRIVGIRGPRGVGKTTLMLQYIKKELEADDVLYVNADDIYFSEHKLLDLAEKLVQRGMHYLFIDEIHKYKDWSKELKLIYDYYSELKVVFSGSSVLDLNKGASDLSRRAVVYHLYGLSFREYLALFQHILVPAFSLDEIVNRLPEETNLKTPLLYFEDYLKRGYYPFAKENSFEEKLRQIINLTLENDIPIFADMPASMGRKFKKLLAIIAKSVPFKPNMSKLAEMIGAGRNQMSDYFLYIEDAGMIAQLRDDTGGVRGLGKIEKVYLDNTNLIYALAENEVNVGNLRETFFLNQVRVKNPVISSSISDFQIGRRTFEVGGKSKGKKQIENAEEGYVVKDQIEFSAGNILPLWWFGLNY